jgi:hypothetical protein
MTPHPAAWRGGRRSSRTSFAAAAEVLGELTILRRRQLLVFPVVARLGHQRVMVRVVVAEDEPPFAVRDVPGRDVHAFLTRDLADNPHGT